MLFRRKKKSGPVKVDDRLTHIAFILDGNGRWAKKRGMPREYGHSEGAQTFKRIVRYCGDIGIKVVTVYAFSTENWSRPKGEVDRIISLLDEYIAGAERELDENKIRYTFLGDKSVFAPEMVERMTRLEEISAHYELRLNIALNYGARDEMVRGMRRMLRDCREGLLEPEELTEERFSSYLDTAGLPDPDLMIRTSGEQRLSNFLLWQLAYTEFYFTPVPWPDFDKTELIRAIEKYNERDRRYGGVKEE